MCCQLKTNRSSEQSGETGSGLFLTDSFLFGLVGGCGRGVCESVFCGSKRFDRVFFSEFFRAEKGNG